MLYVRCMYIKKNELLLTHFDRGLYFQVGAFYLLSDFLFKTSTSEKVRSDCKPDLLNTS